MSSNPTQAFSIQEVSRINEQDLRTFIAMVNDHQTTDGFFRDITAATKFVIDAEKDDIGTPNRNSQSQSAPGDREGVLGSSHNHDAPLAVNSRRSEETATAQNSEEVEVRTAQAVTLERHAVADAGPHTIRRGRSHPANQTLSQPGEHFQTADNTQCGTGTDFQIHEQYARDVSIVAGVPGNSESMPRFSLVLPTRNTDSTFLPDDHTVGINVLGVPLGPHSRTQASSPPARNTDSTFLSDDHILGLDIMRGAPHASLGANTRACGPQPRNTDSTLLTDDHLIGVDIWGVPHAPPAAGVQGPSRPRNTDSTLLTDDHLICVDLWGVPYTSGA